MVDPTSTAAGRAEGKVVSLSFLSLLKTHERLGELFFTHQEALLSLDIPRARACLDQYETELLIHMRLEEDLLLPIYQRAGRIEGGPIEFYTGEHKKMREFLARFNEVLRPLESNPPDLKRRVIKLFDDQAMFKHLVEHHDLRERNILYPTLDRVTSERERRELLSRCSIEVDRPGVVIYVTTVCDLLR